MIEVLKLKLSGGSGNFSRTTLPFTVASKILLLGDENKHSLPSENFKNSYFVICTLAIERKEFVNRLQFSSCSLNLQIFVDSKDIVSSPAAKRLALSKSLSLAMLQADSWEVNLPYCSVNSILLIVIELTFVINLNDQNNLKMN